MTFNNEKENASVLVLQSWSFFFVCDCKIFFFFSSFIIFFHHLHLLTLCDSISTSCEWKTKRDSSLARFATNFTITNIPFDAEETSFWVPPLKENAKWSKKYFRSALRVDQILCGDWKSITNALNVFHLSHTLSSCRQLLLKWIEIMEPEYFMASVPITFQYPEDDKEDDLKNDKVQEKKNMQQPSGADLLLRVLLPLAQEQKLPIALKFDSVRPINPRLGVAGDGVEPSNVNILIKLCSRFPKVKFLATFLSKVNQHQVTVVANKFANLHLYGCWWYCNNPSIIDEMTRMRIEILGTCFTCQHSDARVLDQLIYKWKHSRTLIGKIVSEMYENLYQTGWKLSHEEIERDIGRLFGDSYEEFMQKEL